jgi:two-component sensor histidine kinase
LPANDVLDVLPYGPGRVWIATRNGGLARWNGRAMRAFPLPPGSGSTVHGLTLDRFGKLWCAGSTGFDVLDTTTLAWTHLPLPSGRGIAQASACTRSLSDGRIAFVTDNTLHLFDPAVLDTHTTVPPPYLTDLRSADRPALGRLQNGILALASGEDMLTVAVSALDLSPLEPLRFTLELEGVDPGPRTTNADGSLIYASLPSGTYRLLARTVAPSGRSSPPVLLMTILKHAPVWRRWWFQLLVLGAIAAGLYLLYRYRLAQALRLQTVRNRIASDLHDEVGSSLSSITIGSQLAQRLNTAENAPLRQLLERIGETSSESLRSMSDIVWAIDPKNDEGEALLARMRRIAHELLEGKGITVAIEVSGGVEDLRLPMDTRKDILLIYKEAVHNASKYSKAQEVRIVMKRNGDTLAFSVADNGIGFDPALHPDGHGLGSMRRRADALGGRLSITSGTGHGTQVEFAVRIECR